MKRMKKILAATLVIVMVCGTGLSLAAPTKSLSDMEVETTKVQTSKIEATVESEKTLNVSGQNDVAAVAEDDENTSSGLNLKYFTTTLYDYDDRINEATIKLEADTTSRQGIYFSDGSPDFTESSSEWGIETVPYTVENNLPVFEDGQYAIYCKDTSYYMDDVEWNGSHWGTKVIEGTNQNNHGEAAIFTVKREDNGQYTIQNADGAYVCVWGRNAGHLLTEKNTVDLEVVDASNYSIKIHDDAGGNNGYMNSLGAQSYGEGYFGGYTSGSVFEFRKLTAPHTTTYTYADWNKWSKGQAEPNDQVYGQYTYSGLVEKELDANKDIVFTKLDAGIFNDDATVKDIYPGVKMPFEYNPETNKYLFDSSQNGVYFKADEAQNSTATGNATVDETGTRVEPRLYFDKGNTQTTNQTFADGSSTMWFPFNAGGQINNPNIHFGMRTSIPFAMTESGRLKDNVADSEPIHFSFSGDDDVWVFIDGQLVIDLGGIHNRLNADIDFAANTITLSADNNATDGSGVRRAFGDANGAFAAVDALHNDGVVDSYTTKLFSDDDGVGAIAQDRKTFAATEHHELTIFYLERGAGASNCKIEFNLPAKDTVTIYKDATKSWTPNVPEGETGVTDLTAEEQERVNNIDFGFTLYRKTSEDTDFVPVANTSYYLVNNNGQVVANPSTDGNGYFTLKNGQSAKFISAYMDDEVGVSYYVEESLVSGFVEPDYNYDGESGRGYVVNDAVEDQENPLKDASKIPEKVCEESDRTSDRINIKGNADVEDSIVFICSNFLDAEMPNPSARPNDDMIVIDYGLPVEIDILKNDIYRGDSYSIENIYCVNATGGGMEPLETGEVLPVALEKVEGQYGTLELQTDGTYRYTLKKQLTGVEVFSYIVKAESGDDVEHGTANLYIIPATSMYYEENFGGFNTDNTGAPMGMKYATKQNTDVTWEDRGVTQTACQEPGVVGTYDDSPYGSDKAYINDSTDSNGTSKYVDTTNGYAQFQYEFKGTGTAIMARTSKDTGYIRVIVKEIAEDGTKTTIETVYIDTMVLPLEGTGVDDVAAQYNIGELYNIPVYDNYELPYGNYLVNVTVYQKGTITAVEGGAGKDFYLDGIKVYQPMDLSETDPNAVPSEFEWMTRNVALSAYAADGESNCTVVQLRDKLIDEYTAIGENEGEEVLIWADESKKFVSFTDTNGAVQTADQYVSIGPKNEVYLKNRQSVTFSLVDWDINLGKIYLGLKAPTGTGSVKIGGRTISVLNATDCYYEISQYGTLSEIDGVNVVTFTIEADVDSLISLTNIKVTGIPEFVIIDNPDEGGDIEVPDEGGDIEVPDEGGDIIVPDENAAPDDNSMDISVDQYTATAGSTQSENSPDRAIDGNENNYWEVAWGEGERNFNNLWYQIELDEAAEVQAIRYLPRWSDAQGGQNGFITDYEVKVSVDGQTWETVSTGTWTRERGWKLAVFDKVVTAQYIRLIATGTFADIGENKEMSIAEIRVKGVEQTVEQTNQTVVVLENKR